MRTLVIGDIHGAGLALKQVLERCNFNYTTDLLITIGDIVDGWGDSYMCVEELLKIENRIDIVGNHDDWFMTFANTESHPKQWDMGGLSTAKSYAKACGLDLHVETTSYNDFGNKQIIYSHKTNLLPHHIPESHQSFFRRQTRLYKDDNNNIFIHGGFDRRVPVTQTPRYNAMWNRSLFSEALSASKSQTSLKFVEEVNQVFIGHTATLRWDTDKPINADKVWNIDTGAGGGGRLTIMDVDTNEYWQSDDVPSLYPDDEHNLKNKD